MTEQEKRDKAIEEMTTVLEEVDCQDHNVCVEHRNISCNRCCAERLSDYVLRKEEEVQKETLQKLFHAIKTSRRLFDYSEFVGDGPFWAIDMDDLQEVIEQEFGVEVDE